MHITVGICVVLYRFIYCFLIFCITYMQCYEQYVCYLESFSKIKLIYDPLNVLQFRVSSYLLSEFYLLTFLNTNNLLKIILSKLIFFTHSFQKHERFVNSFSDRSLCWFVIVFFKFILILFAYNPNVLYQLNTSFSI